MTRIYLGRAQTPSLVFYPAPEPNGHGILIIPGGGYSTVVLEPEGIDAVRFFNDRGWHAWLLEYTTTANAPAPLYPTPIREAVNAVSEIRSQNRITGKLGVIGFSAGAHLASLLTTNRSDDAFASAIDTALSDEHVVDFGILAYGVISMEGPAAHGPSKACLLGDNPPPELCHAVSPQHFVSERTAPAFIFHTANDDVVKSQNAMIFAKAMADHERPYEVLVLPDGPHGVHLGIDAPRVVWTGILDRWLRQHVLQ